MRALQVNVDNNGAELDLQTEVRKRDTRETEGGTEKGQDSRSSRKPTRTSTRRSWRLSSVGSVVF